MCELNAYIQEDGIEMLFIEGVNEISVEGSRVILRNLFGEEKVFEGILKELSLSRHKILLQK